MDSALRNIFEGQSAYDVAWTLWSEWPCSVIPIAPGMKRPPKDFHWEDFQKRRATDAQMDQYREAYEGYNWAVVCGRVSQLVVFDADDEAAYQWGLQHLISTPLKVRTGKGWHLYYRYPKGENIPYQDLRDTLGVNGEIRSDGHYVVGPQSIHPSGARYTAFAEYGLDQWDYVPEFGYAKPVEDVRKLTVEQIEAYSSHICEGNRNTKLCSRIGAMVAKGLTINAVMAEAQRINAEECQPPLKAREVSGIVSSVFKMDAKNHPAHAGAKLTSMDGLRLEAIADPDAMPWPDELLHPGGLLQELMDYTERASFLSHPVYDLAGAVVTLATLIGRKVWTQSELTSNVYCVVLGGSASGKNSPKNTVEKVLYAVSKDLVGGTDMASSAAMLTALKLHHRCCFVLDEFGMYLQACKTANSPKAELFKILMDLFTRGNSPYKKPYKNSTESIFISWHNLTLLGLTVPDEFWAAMQSGEATNGFLGRFLVFERNSAVKAPNMDIRPRLPEALLDKLKKLHALNCGEMPEVSEDGNVVLNVGAESKIRTHTLFMTEEAKKFHNERTMHYFDLVHFGNIPGKNAEAKRTVYGRFQEHAQKLALIKVASRVPEDILKPETHIELEDIRWGWLLAETTGEHFIRKMDSTLHVTEFERYCNQAIEVIRKHVRQSRKYAGRGKNPERMPVPGAPLRVIERAMPIKAAQVAEVIDKLVNMDRLRLVEGWKSTPTSRRKLDLYVLVEDAEEEAG